MSGPEDKLLSPATPVEDAAPADATSDKAGADALPDSDPAGIRAPETTEIAESGKPAESGEPEGSDDANVADNANAADFAAFESSMFSGPEWRPDAAPEASASGVPPVEPDVAARLAAELAHTDENGAGAPPLPPSPPAGAAAEPPAPRPEDSPVPAEGAEDDESAGKPMGLMDHLSELRVRLVRCCIAVGLGFLLCWSVVDPIFNALVNPLLAVLPPGSHAQYTTLPEGFFTRMYIAFVAGVFVASPVVFYQVWSFIAPGLYDEEKRYIIPVAILSALFFVTGGAFCYFVVFPYAFSFFVSFSTSEIVVMPKISDYLNFVLKLILAFGLIFEMPLFALFLARMGLITATLMRKTRRYAILGIFIVAAILTPPDVVSQLLMACPMLLLYEISILVAAAFGRKKAAPESETPENAEADNTEKTEDDAKDKAAEEA